MYDVFSFVVRKDIGCLPTIGFLWAPLHDRRYHFIKFYLSIHSTNLFDMLNVVSCYRHGHGLSTQLIVNDIRTIIFKRIAPLLDCLSEYNFFALRTPYTPPYEFVLVFINV